MTIIKKQDLYGPLVLVPIFSLGSTWLKVSVNTDTKDVGFVVRSLQSGTQYFDNLDEALAVLNEIAEMEKW